MLTKQELEYLIRFIDVTAQRGGIRGDELSSSGMIRERLTVELVQLNELENQTTTSKRKSPTPKIAIDE